jgi:hypothetical protein
MPDIHQSCSLLVLLLIVIGLLSLSSRNLFSTVSP